MVVLAWTALIFGATWIYMFTVSVTKDMKENPVTDTYKAATFMFLALFTLFGMLTAIGVTLDG